MLKSFALCICDVASPLCELCANQFPPWVIWCFLQFFQRFHCIFVKTFAPDVLSMVIEMFFCGLDWFCKFSGVRGVICRFWALTVSRFWVRIRNDSYIKNLFIAWIDFKRVIAEFGSHNNAYNSSWSILISITFCFIVSWISVTTAEHFGVYFRTRIRFKFWFELLLIFVQHNCL